VTSYNNAYSNQVEQNILLAGDISKAFLNVDAVENIQCEIHTQLSDAIDAASEKKFDAIAIVMSGISNKLSPALKTLRDTSKAKIVLLAQMYEEPIAIRLTNSIYKNTPLVDDYLICPVRRDNFHELITGTYKSRQYKEIRRDEYATSLDPAIETRIRHLEKLATEDDLTGLKNRRYIREFTRQIIDHAGKENGRVTLLLFDIDDFKQYNDLYGHSTGDEILKQAGVLMQRCCRGHDVVGRIGGDEFAVVFWDDPQISESAIEQAKEDERRSTDSDHPNEAILIARRFVSELEETPTPVGNLNNAGLGPKGVGTLSISGGLASFPRDGSTEEELFQQADKALLEAKRSGKNRIYLIGKPQN
jgi:diguanylate cyclase (GGDEF)-like protein